MQKIVDELRKVLPLKATTEIGDVVTIAAKSPQMLLYAHVSGLERDPSRVDEWWHVTLDLLSIPLQKVVWTLRTEQMSGKEIFTMGGEERFVQAVDFSVTSSVDSADKKTKAPSLKRVK
jgi:hypothetical protein